MSKKQNLLALIKQLDDQVDILDHVCVFRIRKQDGEDSIAIITRTGGNHVSDQKLLLDAYERVEGCRKIAKDDVWTGLELKPKDGIDEVLG